MANLKLTNTEQISVAGKRVNNIKSHNISDINNVYQETLKLNKRPASYTYLYVASVPPVGAAKLNRVIESRALIDGFPLGSTIPPAIQP